MSRTVEVTIRQALQAAQNTPTDQMDPRLLEVLENALTQVWRNIQAQPNAYVMTELEFSVFNFFRARTEFQNETARKAIQRYWDSKRVTDGD